MSEWTIRAVLQWTVGRFKRAGIPSPRVDAETLLAHALGMERVALYLDMDRPLAPDELAAARELIRRRIERIPLQHLTGRTGFRYLELECGPEALVPRQDTECLIEIALPLLRDLPEPRILDVGTGTGAIAFSLASEVPGSIVWATDISEEAIALATRNRERLGLEAVQLICCDLFAGLPDGLRSGFQLIVSNPPYIPAGLLAELQPEVRDWDPECALTPGPRGDETILRLLREAPAWLSPGGHLLIEVGDAAQAGRTIAAAGDEWLSLGSRNDLSGCVRAVLFRLVG